jgi:hypothetical protein
MTQEEIEEVVTITLSIAKSHWVAHGTPIRPEDAIYVAADVSKALASKRLTDSAGDDRG